MEHLNILELFRDAEQNKEAAKNKITMPVLALGGDIYPALGGDIPGNFALSSLQSLATDVKGVTVPFSGHWIPEERPDFSATEPTIQIPWKNRTK